jgi:hypothetical protein
MKKSEMKSFRLARPRCPHCYSGRTRFDWSVPGNLLRLPLAILSGLVFYPLVGLQMRCTECGGGFLASEDGGEAGHWEPITERTTAVARADSA